jgi:hypothetical protein
MIAGIRATATPEPDERQAGQIVALVIALNTTDDAGTPLTTHTFTTGMTESLALRTWRRDAPVLAKLYHSHTVTAGATRASIKPWRPSRGVGLSR